MSVLKDMRAISKAEFVNTAGEIFDETVAFLSRLSARYSRLLADKTADLAGEVMDEAEKANSLYPSSLLRIDRRLRKQRKSWIIWPRNWESLSIQKMTF